MYGREEINEDTVVNKGVDFYIDDKTGIIFVSMNQKMSIEASEKLKQGIGNIVNYRVIVVEKINSVKHI